MHTSCLRFFFFAYTVSGSSGHSISGAVDVAEAMAMVRALNRMTKAGMPESVRIA